MLWSFPGPPVCRAVERDGLAIRNFNMVRKKDKRKERDRDEIYMSAERKGKLRKDKEKAPRKECDRCEKMRNDLRKRKRKTFQWRRVALASFASFGCALQNGGVEARDAHAEEGEERRAGAHGSCCAQDLRRVEACQAAQAFVAGASEQSR